MSLNPMSSPGETSPLVNTSHGTALPPTDSGAADDGRTMLDFENEMFLDILNTDGLVIAAKGLGLEDVFLSLLKVYSDPGNLVLVLGATSYEERYYVDRLTADGVTPLPKVISSESGSASDRIDLYLEGGVLFVPARILVVDLLKERVPLPLITGILVYRAHTVLNSCQEAFAIRLYRQKNKTGFVKAFSSSPLAFTGGFSQVTHIMRMLFLKQLLLWPRFHSTVQASLGGCKPLVVEMHVQLTSEMTTIQNAILALMNLTVKEIKRINPSLDVDDLTVENAISKSSQKMLQSQLDPVWYQLSAKTKMLFADLKLLRVFLNYLTRYDCVTFLTFITSFRTHEYMRSSSGWLLLDAANTLYEAANRRVVGGRKDSRAKVNTAVRMSAKADKKSATAKKRKAPAVSRKKRRVGELTVVSPVKFTQLSQGSGEKVAEQTEEEQDTKDEEEDGEQEVEEENEEEVKKGAEGDEDKKKSSGDPEPSPKWLVLRQVLAEIQDISKSGAPQAVPDRVLVLVEDKLTAKQLQDYLVYGSSDMLQHLRDRQRTAKTSRNTGRRVPNASSATKMYLRQRSRGEQLELLLSTQLLASQSGQAESSGEADEKSEEVKEVEKRVEAEEKSEEVEVERRDVVEAEEKSKVVEAEEKSEVVEVEEKSEGVDEKSEVVEMEEKSEGLEAEGKSDVVEAEEKSGSMEAEEKIDNETTEKNGIETMEDAAEEPKEEYKEVYILSQTSAEVSGDTGANYQVFADKIDDLDMSLDTPSPVFQPPIVIIQTMKASGNPLSLPQTLDEARPRFIVLYDVEVAAIRRIEVYQNVLPEVKVHVYVIVFGGSVEEQAYLTSLRREKEAFESLIREKATMVVPDDQDGKSDLCTELDRTTGKPSETVNSRQGGSGNVAKLQQRQTVIVDMREFNSELPAMLHRRGIEIEPLTLQVGDYILTPEICVERKSISDLIGSLNNGRLYNQARAMTRYYARPILLIESDQNKPLTLLGNYYISNDVSTNDVQARLILLTLHFPQLKIFWSPSPYATAQLFQELKQFREEPDPLKAVGIGADLNQDLDANEKYNPGVYDLLARLPGVTSKNIRAIVTKVRSLDHLATYTKQDLATLLGNTREAECLYNALHRACNPQEEAGNSKKQKMWRGKKFGGPRKR